MTDRPKLNEFPATDSRTYELLSEVVYEDYDWKRFAIDEGKYIDQVLEEKKALSKALKCIANLSEDAVTPLLKAVHQIAFKTLKL